MRVVADTNVFLAVALDEPEKPGIIEMTLGHDLLAPEILPFEVGNALTAMMKRGALDSNEVVSAWDAVQGVSVELRKIDVRTALGIASRFRIYAYDAYFIECAASARCPLLTFDRRMKAIARDMGIKTLERIAT